MLVTWREESERRGLTEQQTLDMLLNALKEVERMDLHQEVLLYRGKRNSLVLRQSQTYTCEHCSGHVTCFSGKLKSA